MLIEPQPADPEVEAELRRLQYTPEERARLFPPKAPFSYEDWRQEAPPATLEELEEREELLRLREEEHEASLAREAGIEP